MKQPICSIEHFKKLQKFFRKMAYKQITSNEHLQKNKLKQLFIYNFLENDLKEFEEKLLNVFKGHSYKTHSCFTKGFADPTINIPGLDENVQMYVSYTVENNSKRCGISSDAYLVFRIFIKVGNTKKRRIVRCKVKLTWLTKN